jgi:hypothetical protein
MKFQVRRFIANVPWAECIIIFAMLLSVMGLLYAIDQRGKSKKPPRCPTCNQVVREAK